MRGVVYASVTLALAATMPHPVAAQCYGPECGRYRSGPPASFNQPPTQYQNPAYQNPGNGQPYQSAPPSPYQQGRSYDQARPR